jgi:hypothetical protein
MSRLAAHVFSGEPEGLWLRQAHFQILSLLQNMIRPEIRRNGIHHSLKSSRYLRTFIVNLLSTMITP